MSKEIHELIQVAYVTANPELKNFDVIETCLLLLTVHGQNKVILLFALGTVIEVTTGLVVDSVVLSKYCRECIKKSGIWQRCCDLQSMV